MFELVGRRRVCGGKTIPVQPHTGVEAFGERFGKCRFADSEWPVQHDKQAWALASRNRFVSLVRMTSGFSGQRTENLALMIPRQREMRLVRVERRARR